MTARRRLVRQLAVRSAVVDADRAESGEHEGPEESDADAGAAARELGAAAEPPNSSERSTGWLRWRIRWVAGRFRPTPDRPSCVAGGVGTHSRSRLAGMAAEFGRPFSSIRVHTDPEADRLARSMQSVALTHGSDIYFSRGSYAPTTASGSHLLAHELAHAAGGSHGGAVVGRADDGAEAAADRTADRIAPAVRRLMGEPGSAAEQSAKSPPAAHPSMIESLHRKISYTSSDLNRLRSAAGVKKGERTNDSLHRIGRLLDKLGRGFDVQEKDLVTLGAISGLCSAWLDKHKGTKNTELLKLVTRIKSEATADGRIAQKQQIYLNDMRAGHRGPAGKRLVHAGGMTVAPFTQQLDQQSNYARGARSANTVQPRAGWGGAPTFGHGRPFRLPAIFSHPEFRFDERRKSSRSRYSRPVITAP